MIHNIIQNNNVKMDNTLFSGFRIVTEMEQALASPTKYRNAFNSPLLTPNSPKCSNLMPLELTECQVEPILQKNPTRFTLFPIMKPKLYQKYKNHVSVFWTPEEIDLTKDMKDWVKLNSNEQMFIKNILGFFAGSDGIIQENLAARFMNEIQLAEARQFYSVQLMIEALHSETYSLLIDTYVDDKEEKANLFKAIETIPCVIQKA